ncbi:indole-3-acetic acid-amido synthetase GH3.10 [Impatiens glandulifera]|uniref:indole-3-acetic acid-amido synthetase GH3.10 n=1 Tax=Impatiens glandulifera TaxID=253017 RepID=UPI001FB138ED|nr:indole-3-acetic acid-amido synthetase GH3.10 [Impatiens glandulifera]
MEMEIIRWFEEEVAEEAGRTQTETLRRILEENCGVEYLRKYMGDDIISLSSSSSSMEEAVLLEEMYRKLVPLSSHSDFDPFIHRIADGDTSPLLTLNPITALSLSSGTTDGRQKLVPFTRHTTLTTFQIFSLAAAYRSRVYPIREGKKALQFIYSSKQYKTKGGLTVGTATTHIYASDEFKTQSCKSCSPQEVISSGDYRQSTYCHLLLGLFFSDDIDYVSSTFAYSIVQALASFEDFYTEICHDIRFGTLSPRITLPHVRKAVLEIIHPNPNPSLATRIEEICNELDQEEVNWAGLIPRLWPNAKYVCSIMTGSMQPYTKKLGHYGGGLPLVSADYGSTESWIGVNVDPSFPPEKVTFAVMPSFSYFEFIPLHKDKCLILLDHYSSTTPPPPPNYHHNYDLIEDDPVPLSQVQVGQQYELVLTTFTGLYRYRLGDIVEVSGFHKGTPKLSFICRRNLILTVNIDKNTEKDLQLVVERASRLLSRAELVDFTSHAEVANQPGHYVVYWEIKGEVEDRVLEECCTEMDSSFVDHGYVVSRRCGSIGPLELRVVEEGTFKKILDYFIEKGGALSQFKTPRCTSNCVLLTILNAATIKTFFSTHLSL